MDYNRHFQPNEPQRYIQEFHHFQDQHVEVMLSDMKRLPGVGSARVQFRDQRRTVVQVFSTAQVDDLRVGTKRIMTEYGYRSPRGNFSGNRMIFTNTNRF